MTATCEEIEAVANRLQRCVNPTHLLIANVGAGLGLGLRFSYIQIIRHIQIK